MYFTTKYLIIVKLKKFLEISSTQNVPFIRLDVICFYPAVNRQEKRIHLLHKRVCGVNKTGTNGGNASRW